MICDNNVIDILEKREYLVVKGNNLIQKSRYELTVSEQRTIAYICSLIKPVTLGDRVKGNKYSLEYQFDIPTYCRVCGIEYEVGGENYRIVKDTLKRLRDRSMWVDYGDKEALVSWLDNVDINKGTGVITVEINKRIAPYLIDLKEKFTQYQLYNILSMKSAFSIRLYELFKSYAYLKYKEYDLDELKKILSVDKVKSYSRFPDFRRTVLEKALSEINSLTDINVTYETITKGRKVVGIKFYIKVLKTTF